MRASTHAELLAVLQLPSDVAQYQDVQQLYQEVQSYQQHFVELHRATTAATPTGEDPAALKVKLVQLDSQKQQLQDKLLKIRGKVQNVANLPALQVQSDSTCRSRLINSLACMIPVYTPLDNLLRCVHAHEYKRTTLHARKG